MRIRLDDVPAPVLNGYALRALGAELDGGGVGVDIALTANAVFVGHAELIATNVLPPAAKLSAPIELGLALLEDRGRTIKVELPIEVAADSGPPVATVVTDELGRHLARLGAAPHSTLGALVGRDADGLRAVGFLPAEPVPTPAGAETLVALAEALALRPRVGVVIRGGFDPLADRRALATRQVELHVLLATAGSTHRARPQPVDFASPRAQDILDEFARERLPPEEVATLASLFDLRGNAGPASSARLEYYRAIFDALVAHESIPESALLRLGRFRAQAIRNMLAERGVEPHRIAVLGDTAPLFAPATDVVSIPLDLEPVEHDTTVNLGSER
jgi:hypothetical protein